jgi:alpha-mannosidase
MDLIPFIRTLLYVLTLMIIAVISTDRALAGPKRVFMAPDDHTDYFWSATDVEYKQAFVTMLDYYLDQADATAGEPSNYQSRFSTDGTLWIRAYEQSKPPAAFQRLVDRIKSGHISTPLNPLVITYGAVPAEAVIRSMYYGGQLERRYGIDLPIAIAMENATMPYGLSSLWAGSGAKYSWKGVCACWTEVTNLNDRQNEIYNSFGPDGTGVLLKWFSLRGAHGNEDLGGYAEARYPDTAFDEVTVNATSNGFAARYPFDTIGVFGQGWDDLSTTNLKIQQTCKAKGAASNECIVSNMTDFFEEFGARYGASVPTVRASFGNEWDLSAASMAEVSARVKRAIEKLRCAEALATLVALKDPSFLNGRAAARDLAFLNFGLYFEHDFENGGPRVSGSQRIAWQRQVATEIETYTNTLLTDATTALGTMIQKSGSNPRFFVFNPLSWVRTDVADIPYNGASSVHVVDLSSGTEVPAQVVNVSGTQYLRVQAQNLPPVGYKVFEIQSGTGQSFAGVLSADPATGVMQNDVYRIVVSPRGAITSLVDKRLGNREFAQLTGGYALNDLGAASGTLKIENAGPVSMTLVATSKGPLDHTTRVTLTRGSDRVSIQNEVTQNFGGTQYWKFTVNVTNPIVRHEEVGAILTARLTTYGGDYAPKNARYDALTLNHFADMSGAEDVGLTISNTDAYFMTLGASTPTFLDTTMSQISVMLGSSLRPSNPILNQAGDSYFLQRFALQSHGSYDQAAAMRFALEHQTPPTVGAVSGGAGNPYPETSYSYLSISDPNVLLWALKPSDEGISEGVVTRVWNLASSPKTFSMTLNGPIGGAKRIAHIETDIEDATVQGGTLVSPIAQQQLLSFRLFPSSMLPSVKIVVSDAKATESGDSGSFTIIRTGSTQTPLDVTYSLGGTATPGTDYQALSGLATIPVGATSTVINVIPVNDAVTEPDETVTVTLTPQPNYLVGLWSSATASIINSAGGSPAGPSTSVLYPFNEGSGTVTVDASGNGSTGTLTNGAAWTTAGKYSNALNFDGIDDYVVVSNGAGLDLGSTGTIEAWVKLNAINRWNSVIAKGGTNNDWAHNYALEVNNANRFVCILGNGSAFITALSTTLATTGQFYHVACVWNGTTLQVYVNGSSQASTAQNITPAAVPAPLYIGQFGGNTDRLSGTIDEVRIYSKALSSAEITSDMNTAIDTTRPGVSITSPTAGATVSNTVTVSATASDNVGVGGVQFTLDGANLGSEDTSSPYSVSWSTALSQNGTHVLSARVRDIAGNLGTAPNVSVTVNNSDVTAPSVPTGVAAAAVSSTQINLSWNASSDAVGVTGYRLTRNGSVLASTTATSYQNTGLASGATYTYTVAAFDAAGNTSAESSPVSATTSGAPPPIGSTLVLSYKFQEGTGTTTADGSGNGNTGMLATGSTWTPAGKYGNAVAFDGSSGYIAVPDSSSLDAGNTGTIEAWVKVNSLNRWQSVIAKGNANNNAVHNYALEISNANRFVCILGNGSAATMLTSTVAVTQGQFTHVTCVWNGSNLELYINGVLNASMAQNLIPSANASPLYIGQFGGSTDRLNGVIDEVRIYNQALSPSQVQSDMNTPL